MAELSVEQVKEFINMSPRDKSFDIPYPNNPAQKEEAACWNWALTGCTCLNPQIPYSPENLYENTGPTRWERVRKPKVKRGRSDEDFDEDSGEKSPKRRRKEPLNADTREFKEVKRKALDTSTWAHLCGDCKPICNAWKEANRTQKKQDKISFMREMLKFTALVHNLSPSEGPTFYKLHVITRSISWFSWEHWGISVEYNKKERFIQTEPGKKIDFEDNYLWHYKEREYIMASIYMTNILPEHKEGIVLAIMQPPANAIWQPDTASVNCQRCGNAFARQGFLWAKSGKHHCRRCGRLVCQTCSTHTAQVYRPLNDSGGVDQGFHTVKVCDDCYALATGQGIKAKAKPMPLSPPSNA